MNLRLFPIMVTTPTSTIRPAHLDVVDGRVTVHDKKRRNVVASLTSATVTSPANNRWAITGLDENGDIVDWTVERVSCSCGSTSVAPRG